ncbi:hypothetical protein TGDOM2_279355 [Toxoplasma gondii GAB2-2007-GAL-DOM2]|uniref:Transmembrane protein n=5 Tax=Toxoplasma gondii TaxID=5811 RepID=S7VQ25_TOXGG|nr:hypothetical protein TGGT1_279355 [Toxoplasma gondii GT1]KAF4644020.1 hypothetical protein TGRH88_010180 [Toxoplasma gondii]KFG38997.1 hypothetical protein TGDOM2_279355 [Toxoplasma gondii GAB2-2007-GAL-DOM2]KFG42555.1 hypothetical protein TGFOU_279355 [Toxoplasma gondii FOU]RQX74245.1 hypothetical protein TGCAST_279355 [Toxoplasma gondii CAST]
MRSLFCHTIFVAPVPPCVLLISGVMEFLRKLCVKYSVVVPPTQSTSAAVVQIPHTSNGCAMLKRNFGYRVRLFDQSLIFCFAPKGVCSSVYKFYKARQRSL